MNYSYKEYDRYGREYYDNEDCGGGFYSMDESKYVKRPEADPGVFGDWNYDAWDEYGNRTHRDISNYDWW